MGGEYTGPRLKLLRRYLQSHHIIILGYGGYDYWDVHPLLFERGFQGMIWVDHTDSHVPEVMTSSESYALLRIRDHVERLLAFSPGRVRVRVHTMALLQAVASSLGISPKPLRPKPCMDRSWRAPVQSWARERDTGALVDFATIVAACGDLRLAHEAFAQALSGAYGMLSPSDRVEALVGRARTTSRPEITDLDEALLIAESLADPQLRVAAMVEKAIAIGNQDFREEAIGMLSAAADLALDCSLYYWAGLCYANIGHQYARLRKYEEAERSYSHAEAILHMGGVIPELITTLRNHAELLALNICSPWAIRRALDLYLQSLAWSWGRRLNSFQKKQTYSRVLVCLRTVFPDPRDAVDYLVNDALRNRTGVAEHLVHWIVEHGYSAENLVLEGWQHEMKRA